MVRDLCLSALCVFSCGACGFVYEVARDDMATSILRKALMDGSMVACIFLGIAAALFGARAFLEA